MSVLLSLPAGHEADIFRFLAAVEELEVALRQFSLQAVEEKYLDRLAAGEAHQILAPAVEAREGHQILVVAGAREGRQGLGDSVPEDFQILTAVAEEEHQNLAGVVEVGHRSLAPLEVRKCHRNLVAALVVRLQNLAAALVVRLQNLVAAMVVRLQNLAGHRNPQLADAEEAHPQIVVHHQSLRSKIPRSRPYSEAAAAHRQNGTRLDRQVHPKVTAEERRVEAFCAA